MYPVSDKYKQVVFNLDRHIDAHITFDTTVLGADELVPRTLMVHGKTSDDSIFSVGGCITTYCQFTVLPGKLSTSIIGKQVSVETGLLVDELDMEFTPVGKYTVYDSSFDYSGTTIYMKDDMSKFDASIPSGFERIGKPYDLISNICAACNVTFGSTKSFIESLPNGNSIITIRSSSSSYVDALRSVCATLSTIGIINRDGNFEVRQYGYDTGITINVADRFNGAVLEYAQDHYTQVSVYQTETERYVRVSLQQNVGNDLDLGVNLCMQGSTSEAQNLMTQILNHISSLSFNPFSASTAEGIFFDLGDKLTMMNMGTPYTCIINEFNYTFGGSYSFKGYGYSSKDLELINSAIARQLARLQSAVDVNSQNISELSLDLTDVAGNFANFYNSSTNYSVGDYCVYNNVLYRCTSATTGTFDPSAWSSFKVIDLQTGSIVTYSQALQSGTQIGTITIDGSATNIYAPTPTSVLYTPTQISGDELGTLTVDGTSKKIYGKQYSTVSVTQTQLTGDPIGTITIDDQSTTLYSPEPEASALSELSDVSLTTPTDGQVLAYDANADEWVNANASGGSQTLAGLTDVDFTTLMNGQVLKYSSILDKWVNADNGLFTCDLLVENTDFSVAGGSDGVTHQYTLSRSIDLYDAVLVIGYLNVTNVSTKEQAASMLILKQDYYINVSGVSRWSYLLNGTIPSQNRRLAFGFINSTTIETACSRVVNEEPKLYRVYGLKFGSSYALPLIYSTEEREIGCWVDGKPLYQKTEKVTLDSPLEPQSSRQLNLSSFPSSTKLISVDSVLGYYNGSSATLSNVKRFSEEKNYDTGFDGLAVYYEVAMNSIYVRTGTNYGNYPGAGVDNRMKEFYVTYRYIKNSDTAGSGHWTSAGETHHYSTSEQIVGTWIDGKPLYEKTVSFTTGNAGTYNRQAHNISNVDKIWVDFSNSFVNISSNDNHIFNGISTFSETVNREEMYVLAVDVGIDYRVGNDMANKPCCITLRYTKTTDVGR